MIGRDISMGEVRQQYQAVFVGIGEQKGIRLRVPGEDAPNVFGRTGFLPKGEHYKVKLELCNGCKKCADACPCGYIEMN